VDTLNRVREIRLKAHLSQDELAEKSGLARPTISKIERGETIPSGLSRTKIADALEVQVAEIFPDEKSGLITSYTQPGGSNVMGIAIINGTMAAAGVRGVASGDVSVKEARIEGFLIDQTGKKVPNALVHLINDGEKVDSTVTGRNGRFVFKDLEEGEYALLSEDKFQTVSVNYTDETFEFEI
jgi:transcriptional regulator with XRE-family HTH domain